MSFSLSFSLSRLSFFSFVIEFRHDMCWGDAIPPLPPPAHRPSPILFQPLLWAHPETGRTTSAGGELGGELGVLLGDEYLRPCGFGVGKGIHDFPLRTGELSGALKVLESGRDVVLLEEELSHGGDGNVAFRIDYIID